jgi:hypothetical protein
MQTARTVPKAAWVGVAIVTAIVVLIVAWQFFVRQQLFSVAVCDAWTVQLRDGTILYAPGYSEERAYGGGMADCWELPAGITMDDLAQ